MIPKIQAKTGAKCAVFNCTHAPDRFHLCQKHFDTLPEFPRGALRAWWPYRNRGASQEVARRVLADIATLAAGRIPRGSNNTGAIRDLEVWENTFRQFRQGSNRSKSK